MNQNKTAPVEKRKKSFSKKQWLHYLLVYLVCLLAACLVWLLVHYTMRTEESTPATLSCDGAAVTLLAVPEETEVFYG